jgi:hypothetical protein
MVKAAAEGGRWHCSLTAVMYSTACQRLQAAVRPPHPSSPCCCWLQSPPAVRLLAAGCALPSSHPPPPCWHRIGVS